MFDLLYGANLSEAGVDSLAGFNVHSLALRVPKSSLRGWQPDHRRVGHGQPSDDDDAHAGSETSAGNFVQVSRLGMPLVNEVVIPVGQKDKWNGSKPTDDGQFLSYVTDPEVPKLLQAIYKHSGAASAAQRSGLGVPDGRAGLNQPARRQAC